MKKKHLFNKGFTLIELLVVIAIIAILAVLVFVALNPAKRFQDSRNSRRATDVGEILTAVHSCIVDNSGDVTPCLGTLTPLSIYEIVSSGGTGCDDVCSGITGATSDTHCADLDGNLQAYLKALPIDPAGAATGHTEYTISVDTNNIVTINSCSAEAGVVISASR